MILHNLNQKPRIAPWCWPLLRLVLDSLEEINRERSREKEYYTGCPVFLYELLSFNLYLNNFKIRLYKFCCYRQGCHGQGKSGKNKNFSRLGKSQEIF